MGRRFMIKVTLSTVVNSNEIFQKLVTTEMRARAAFRTAKLTTAIAKELELFNTQREAILRKYGEKDSSGELIVQENGTVNIEKEHINDFNQELFELLNSEVELNAEPLTVDDIDAAKLTPAQIQMLGDLLVE